MNEERIKRKLAESKAKRTGVRVLFERGHRVPAETHMRFKIIPRRNPKDFAAGSLYYAREAKKLDVGAIYGLGYTKTGIPYESKANLKPKEVKEAIHKTFKAFPKAKMITGHRITGAHALSGNPEQAITNPTYRKLIRASKVAIRALRRGR